MPNKIIIICILILVILTISTPKALADVAPPSKSPGSSINPSKDTMVQMVAENILMVVKAVSNDSYVIEVTADFAMRNQGEEDEQLQVRFPMEDISGDGDGWGGHPVIRNFITNVNKIRVPTEVREEPYQTDIYTIKWLVFNVNFPAGKEANIRVQYVTDLQVDNFPIIEYILGTGAGWFGPIGTVMITIRLPYSAGQANVYFPEPANAVIIGKEIRWHWNNYEPKADEIVKLTIANPVIWEQILNLEAETGKDPNNLAAVIELSKLYQEAGSEKGGCMVIEANADLSEMAIEQALALYPRSVPLHIQLAEVYNWRLGCSNEYNPTDPTIQKLQDELKEILELDPSNERANELALIWKKNIADIKIHTPSIYPTVTKTKPINTTTVPAVDITQKVTSSPVPTLIKTPQVETALVVTETSAIRVHPETNANMPVQVFVGISLLIIGGVAGIVIEKNRRKVN